MVVKFQVQVLQSGLGVKQRLNIAELCYDITSVRAGRVRSAHARSDTFPIMLRGLSSLGGYRDQPAWGDTGQGDGAQLQSVSVHCPLSSVHSVQCI